MPIPAEFLSSRPEIRVNGHIHPELAGDLFSLSVEQDFTRPACCRLLANNWGDKATHPYFDDQPLAHGDKLSVSFVKDSPVHIFEGQIDSIGGVYVAGAAPQIQIRAHDCLEQLRRNRVSRRFLNMTAVDAIKDIVVSEHGLSVTVELGGGPVTHLHLTQANESDLEFCYRLARNMDACLFVKQDEIAIRHRGAIDANPIELEFGRNLISFNPEANIADQVAKVSVHGWNPEDRQPIVGIGDGISGEVDGQSGSQVAIDVYGHRDERLFHTVPLDANVAAATAGARFAERARRFVTGRGVCDGDPNLRVNDSVDLKGVGTLFNGQYMLVATTHSFNPEFGYRTEFLAVRPDFQYAGPRGRRTGEDSCEIK